MSLPRKKYTLIRAIVLGLLFIVQIVWVLSFLTHLLERSLFIDVTLQLLSFIMLVHLIRKDENPAYRHSWMILIALVPIFGGLFYVLFGNKRTTKKMARRLRQAEHIHRQDMLSGNNAQAKLSQRNPRMGSLAQYVTQHANANVQDHSAVDYYGSGEVAFPHILDAVERAERYIFIEFFIIKAGRMADAIFELLAKKASEGIEVRLIFDDYGTMMTLPYDFEAQMEAKGIQCLKFNPFTAIATMAVNTRDHRKMIVVDGKVGFTGGMNIADEYINVTERFGYWKDNFIRIEGEAVWNLVTLFLNMWNAFKPQDADYNAFRYDFSRCLPENTGFVQVFGDSPLDSEALGENVYRDILNQAVDYVYIYTPYLVISYELQTAMALAAKRGVDVRLMTPGIPDKKMVYRLTRSYYLPLIEAGVRIFEYSPGFLHAKTFVCDDAVASVGSINLDYRSLYLHFELNALLYYHAVIPEIKADFLQAQKQSREVIKENCRSSLIGQMWDALLRLAAPFV